MKRLFSFCILHFAFLIFALPLAAQQQLTAFPGAEGYGKFTTGGRGGEVCYVTSLADCSDDNLVEGTLRWAIRHDNGGVPRTILFKVSGTILTTSDLKFAYPNVSILGQTAPNGGICIAGYKFYVCQSNVIIRYIRFRAGDLAGWKSKKSCPSIDIENVKHVILDHCSITWSMEECLTMYDNDSTTVQNCILGEALYNSMNAKGARAYATQWGGEHSTMHHCLLTNSNNRIPRFNGVRNESKQRGEHDYQVDSEFANNVVFNWGKENPAYGAECDTTAVKTLEGYGAPYNKVSMLANYYKHGPAWKKKAYMAQGDKWGEFYFRGNQADTLMENFKQKSSAYPSVLLVVRPDSSDLEIEDALSAYQKVVTKSGASLPCYDPVDTRLLNEAAGKQAPKYFGPSTAGGTTPARGIGIIDTPNNIDLSEYNGKYIRLTIADVDTCNIYPDLSQLGTAYTVQDADGDGMPDTYETLNSLNPNDASDGATLGTSGYTHLEEYLNGVAAGRLNRDGSAVPTAVDELNTITTAEKFLRGGQLYIRKSGHIFDATGQLVR